MKLAYRDQTRVTLSLSVQHSAERVKSLEVCGKPLSPLKRRIGGLMTNFQIWTNAG